MRKLIVCILAILSIEFSLAQSYNFKQAEEAFDQNDYEKALDFFGRELEDNPSNALAYYYRALIYKYQNKNAFALTDINNAIKNINAKEKKLLAGAYQLRGDIYYKIENYDKTFDDYAKAIKLNPEDPELYIDRAQIYYSLEKYNEAEADYQQVIKINEGEARAWAGLGRNYIAKENFKEADKVLNQLIKLSPQYPTGYYYRSILYYVGKRYDEAITDIYTCLRLDPRDEDAETLFVDYASKNYPLAISKVNAQISLYPKVEYWYYLRAQLYRKQNKLSEAIADYTKLLQFSDTAFKANLFYNRGMCYSGAGLFKEAISDFTESVSIDSSNAYVYGYRGDANRLLGNYPRAVEDFTKAINIEHREGWFYYRRGWVKDEFMNNFKEGLKDYDEAIAIDKNYSYTYLHRGRLYEEKLNNVSKAREDYMTILALDTVVLESSNCRHYALFHLGRNEESIAWLKKIIDTYPTEGNYYDAACLYSLMNRQGDAIVNLKIAFQNGYRDFVHLSKDDDLNNIRNNPEFIKLVKEWKQNSEKTN